MKARGIPRRKGESRDIMHLWRPERAERGYRYFTIGPGAFSAYRAGGGRALSAESPASDGFRWSADCERGGDQCSISKFISSGRLCTSGFRNCYFVSWMKNSSPVWKTAIAVLDCLTGGGSSECLPRLNVLSVAWPGFAARLPTAGAGSRFCFAVSAGPAG